jgi:hypothetical protein
MAGVRAVALAMLAACAAQSAPPRDVPSPGETEPGSKSVPAATSAPTVRLPGGEFLATDLLQCEGAVSEMGGFADDFGPDGGGSTPEEAFAAWLEENPFPVPRSGYEPVAHGGDRWAWAFRADGRVKVVVVISPRFGEFVGMPFTIEELRLCDPAELGSDADLGPGQRIWTHVETGRILTDIAGPGHCGWESARMLHVERSGRLLYQYLRDPEGVFNFGGLEDTYAEGVELPGDAFFSGYRTEDGLELWFTPENRAAYVVTPDGIERWPRATEPIGCV